MYKFTLIGIFALLLIACNEPKAVVLSAQSVKEPVDSTMLDFVMGKFDPELDSNFVKIDPAYADQDGRLMQREAYDAFRKMYAAAQKADIQLKIKSATRNFDYQKGIWERKWTGATILSDNTNAAQIKDEAQRALKILEYSSMPGTSRHHWGTDIDLNAFENSWFESGEGLKIYNWLNTHAHEYGFCQPYTKKDSLRPNGYNEEKWHWSYLPLSEQYTAIAESHLKNSMIQGAAGANTATAIDVKQKYILGINRCAH